MNENGTCGRKTQRHDAPLSRAAMVAGWYRLRRFRAYEANNHVGVILYSGEDDSSGKDMTRDLAARMKLFENVCRGKEAQCLWK